MAGSETIVYTFFLSEKKSWKGKTKVANVAY